jgi:hypothetical protein
MSRPALPGVLEEIAEVAGIDAAWALVHAKGGTEQFLPEVPPHRHWLVEAVGMDAAKAICAHFRGNHQMRITIPRAHDAQQLERWREAVESGKSANETALEMGVTARTVWNWRARLRRHRKPDPNQGSLF